MINPIKKYHRMRVLAAQINPTIGDLEGNARKICETFDRARKMDADIVLFPELVLSGYPPEDLLLEASFIDRVLQTLQEVAEASKGLFALVGLPRWNEARAEKPLYNSAAVLRDGQIIGYHNKQLLPTYDVFDERRYFEPGEGPSVFEFLGRKIAVTICEDLWQHSQTVGYTHYKCDPVKQLQEREVDLVLNLSASPYAYKRNEARIKVFSQAAAALQAPLILCNQVGANDQLIFDGHSLHLNEKGELIQLGGGFEEHDLWVDLDVHACPCACLQNDIADLYRALVLGVRDYFHKQGFKKALLGLSGGIDSALVACIAKEALGAVNVMALAMPSRFSLEQSFADADLLSIRLGIELHKVSIEPIFQAALDLVEPYFEQKPWDVAEENLQSRARCQILMAFSNKFSALVLNAGNKSEMAAGYTTLYGDMCGALGVLHDVTKLKVYELARYVNSRQGEIIPQSILTRVPTAELRAGQTDFDTLPPYEILDPIIEDLIEERLSTEEISRKRGQSLEFVQGLVAKIHAAEYKRRQAPIGLRVTQKAFSKGRNVPIVQRAPY